MSLLNEFLMYIKLCFEFRFLPLCFSISVQFYHIFFFCMLKLEFRLLMRRELAILSGSSLMICHDLGVWSPMEV